MMMYRMIRYTEVIRVTFINTISHEAFFTEPTVETACNKTENNLTIFANKRFSKKGLKGFFLK